MNQSAEKFNFFDREKKELSEKEEKLRLTIEKFLRGEEIIVRRQGINLKVFWAGGYYSAEVLDEFPIDKNILIRDIFKGNFIQSVDIAGIRVILKDPDSGHLIGHADWRVFESGNLVIVNGNSSSISKSIKQRKDLVNFHFLQDSLREESWKNGIDIDQEFRRKSLGKLLIALRLVLLKRYYEGREVLIDLSGYQNSVVRKIYGFFIPEYEKIYFSPGPDGYGERISLKRINWDLVDSFILEWLN